LYVTGQEFTVQTQRCQLQFHTLTCMKENQKLSGRHYRMELKRIKTYRPRRERTSCPVPNH
jgi:hypothetical protein